MSQLRNPELSKTTNLLKETASKPAPPLPCLCPTFAQRKTYLNYTSQETNMSSAQRETLSDLQHCLLIQTSLKR